MQKDPTQKGPPPQEACLIVLENYDSAPVRAANREGTVPPRLVPPVFWSGWVLGYELDNLLTLVSVIP